MPYATKRIGIVGFCLTSMLLMGMGLAGNAAAEGPLWLLCLEGSNANNTKYEDSSCTKAKSTGKWESVAIGSKSVTVKIAAFSLRLEDTKGELGAAVKISCPHVSSWMGLIEGVNLLLVREAKVKEPSKECTAEGTGVFKICKSSSLEAVEAVHLPWVLEMAYGEEEGKFINGLEPSGEGKGEPGWIVKCAGQTDECVSEGSNEFETLSSTNTVSEGVLLVSAEFLKKYKEKCSVGGKESGVIEGHLAFLEAKGTGLAAAETVSRITLAPRAREDFGNLEVKVQTKKTTFTYTNPAGSGLGMWVPGGPIVLEEFPMGGAGGIKVLKNACNVLVAEGASCKVEIEFAPAVRGSYQTAFKLSHAPFLVLEGTGV